MKYCYHKQKVEAFHRREKLLKLQAELLDVEQARLGGAKDWFLDELDAHLDCVIEET